MLTHRTSDVRGRIIQAATALFSRQGFHGTSTREIARLAEVSEVTIFRYFEHKDDIFWSALDACFDSIRTRLESLDRSAKRDNPEIMLPQLISVLVDIATYSPEMIRLMAVALLELRGKAEDLCRENLTPLFATISAYLSKNIETRNGPESESGNCHGGDCTDGGRTAGTLETHQWERPFAPREPRGDR